MRLRLLVVLGALGVLAFLSVATSAALNPAPIAHSTSAVAVVQSGEQAAVAVQRVSTEPAAPFGYPSPGIFRVGPLGTLGTASIEASISYDFVATHGFAAFANVTFTIRQSPGGAILVTGTKTTDPAGSGYFNRWQDHNVDLTIGMQVTATDGSTTKDLTLVPVSVAIMNMATNVVTGMAPASSSVHVDVGQGMSWTGKDTTADGTGHWSVDFSPLQITADMQANAFVTTPTATRRPTASRGHRASGLAHPRLDLGQLVRAQRERQLHDPLVGRCGAGSGDQTDGRHR
jgi:hypothetical protein